MYTSTVSSISLQQRHPADAACHSLPGAGIARHGNIDDRNPAYPASGTQFRFPMGRTLFLHVRIVIPRHGHAPRIAGIGKSVPPAPLFPDLCGPGTEWIPHDLLVGQLRSAAYFMMLPFLIAHRLKGALVYYKYMP